MSNLKKIREKHNWTQEELTEKSGISVRTIQRIEAGTEPKGQTLKILSRALGVEENELLERQVAPKEMNLTLIKFINLSSLPFAVFPPANIILPLLIMFAKKHFNPLTKQIVSLQILWTILSVILFMLTSFMKNWFSFGGRFSLMVMVILVLSNVFIILRNTAEIDRKGKLYFRLSFSII